MAGPIQFLVNGEEREGLEWSWSTEEILGGTGRATLRVQDRTNSWEPACHDEIEIKIRATGWNLFHGEVISEPVDLPVKHPFRIWGLDCSDYNAQMPLRKVGALDGKTWEDTSGLGIWVNVDPYANSLKTDQKTVRRLLDHYLRVHGHAFDTDDYVFKYLDDFTTIFWTYTDVQKALEDMAALVADNLQFWVDPDLKFHWVVIPAWYDILQDEAALDEDDTASVLAGMMPEGIGQFDVAPAVISDEAQPGTIGGRGLKFTLDGSDMPQQIYVRGSTGFVYNAGSIDPTGNTKKINPQGYGVKASETLQLTFNETTKIWRRTSDGFIDPDFVNAAASGPWNVRFVEIPWDPSVHKGGHFWKLLNGPYKGKFVDNDTNYFNYGDITVERINPKVTEPKIGVGGSGWVNSVDQDRNKRQAYLEAPISDSQRVRDRIGRQALYRAKHPTLRGSITVSGVDGWRAGQVVKIIDERLPSDMNGRYFMIQRVQAKPIEGQDVREYTLDFGDGPVSRWSMKGDEKNDGRGLLPEPGTDIEIKVFDLSPGPNSTQRIQGQIVNKAGAPWRIPGKVVKWSVEAYNSSGARVQSGSLSPRTSITDANGRAYTKLTTGPETGYVYYVFADVAAN